MTVQGQKCKNDNHQPHGRLRPARFTLYIYTWFSVRLGTPVHHGCAERVSGSGGTLSHPPRSRKEEELEAAAIKKSPSRRFWTAAVSLPTATNPSPFALCHRLSLDSIQPLCSNDDYDVAKFKCETSSSSPARELLECCLWRPHSHSKGGSVCNSWRKMLILGRTFRQFGCVARVVELKCQSCTCSSPPTLCALHVCLVWVTLAYVLSLRPSEDTAAVRVSVLSVHPMVFSTCVGLFQGTVHVKLCASVGPGRDPSSVARAAYHLASDDAGPTIATNHAAGTPCGGRRFQVNDAKALGGADVYKMPARILEARRSEAVTFLLGSLRYFVLLLFLCFDLPPRLPMAASLQGLVPLRRPDPDIYGIRPGADSFPVVVAPCFLGPAHSPLSKRWLGARLVSVDRRSMKIIPLAASGEEQNHSDVELEKGAGASQEAWKKALQRFMTEALKVMDVSEGAYGIYSKKAIEILMDTFEKLKIQADKAQHDLRIIAKEFSKEGKEYFSAAAKNSPDSLRDILEIYASARDLKNMSAIRDFYLGIPYGSFLAVGGFIYFMLTGSIPAIRFGVILGTAILALSVSSLRSWKNRKATSLLLIGQTAISSIIFCRQWLLCSERGSFSSLLTVLISGAMVGFYAYRFVIDHREVPKRGTEEFRELVIGEGDQH